MKQALDDASELDGFDDLRDDDQARVRAAFESGKVADEDVPDSARKPAGEDAADDEDEDKPKKKRAPAKKKDAAPADGEGAEKEQMQLVAQGEGTEIRFTMPDGPPPAELKLEGPGLENVSVEDVRKYLTTQWEVFEAFPEALKAALDAPGEFYANCAPGKCSQCQKEIVHAGWLQLKYAWVAAMETCPAEVASGRILQRPEVHEVLGATCQHCQRKLYNPEVTMVKLKAILDRLPTSVDVRAHPRGYSSELADNLYTA